MNQLDSIRSYYTDFSDSSKKLIFRALSAFLFLLSPVISFSQITSAPAGGAWSAPATWIGGVVPTAGQSVTIATSGSTVTLDYNTPVYNNITVNAGATLLIQNTATSTLNYSGNMVVAGTLNNQGGILQTTTGKAFQLNGNGSYTHNPRSNTLLDETIFSRSTETFSITSNLTILKWFDLSIALGDPTRVGAPCVFGNVTLAVPDTISWEQDGLFMDLGSQRVFGTLTVSAGNVSMDNGAGLTSLLILNSVMINGTGRVVFSSGANRPYILNTGAFTDMSTATKPTIIMDNCFGNTTWNVNGPLNIGHNFFGILGVGNSPFGALTITVQGALNITNGNVSFVSGAIAPLQLTVNGNTTISGASTVARFIDGNSGNLTYVTNHLTISGGINTLMGGNFLLLHATGIPSITINNDFTVSGITNSYILDAPNSTQKLRLHIGGNMIINGPGANITIARHKGAMTLNTVGNLTLTSGKFIGQMDTLSTGIDSVIVGGSFMMNTTVLSDFFRINYGQGNTFMKCVGPFTIQNSGTGSGVGFTGIYNGTGNMTFNALANFSLGSATAGIGRFTGIYNSKPNNETGNFTFTTGINFAMYPGYFYRGIDNRTTPNPGTINFTTGNLNYSGGNFSGYYAVNNAGGLATYTINGLLQVTFNTAATDSFSFIGYTEASSIISTLRLTVSVAGNFNITGANGSFISSLASGQEIINVTGAMNISGGKNSFNSYPASNLPNAHPVFINVGGDMSVNGGLLYLSAHNDSLTAVVNGNYSMSNGELIVQAGNSPASLTINGGYTQSAGTFYLHKNATDALGTPVNVYVNADNNAVGDFSHTGGIINFDNNTISKQSFLTINSPNITFGGTGSITMATPGTNSIWGVIYYGRAGITNFSRLSTTHSIQQVEQHILAGNTFTVISGNVQVASHTGTNYNSFIINAGSVLDLQGNQLFSNNLQPNCAFRLSGRLRTTRTQGFYDGTTAAAINSIGNIKYLIFPPSTVEYYGSDTQVITGIGVGTAIGSSQKYFNLEINFTGTANTEFVYPTNVPNNRTVFVRNKLTLTNGELNLDNDHDPSSGGRAIILESDSLTSIARTNGYIRSEVYDSSACVIWRANSRVGARTIPFGYNAASYIPYTFSLSSGNADTLFVSTYHTPTSNNLPYPPSVPHVNGLSGTNNSAGTVDRFWYIRSTGTNQVATMSFMVTPAEITGITDPRAQAWIPGTVPGWQYPYQGTQSSIGLGTLMVGATYFPQNWWTLSGLSTPLPVSMLDFTGDCKNDKTILNWSTATEINNDYFTILESNDGMAFEPVGFVNGNGNTTSIHHYSYTAPETANLITYYKLRQTDYNGTITEFGPVMVTPCKVNDVLEVSVIPTNPDELSVIIKNPIAGKYVVSLLSMDGKPVISKTTSLEEGINIVPLYTGNLAAAIYIVRVQNGSESVTKKVGIGFAR